MPVLTSALVERSSDGPGLAPILLNKALLIGLWMETLLYGVSAVLFSVSIWVIIYKRSSARVNRVMLVTTIVLFILSTIHVSIDLARNVIAFTGYPDGSIAYFSDLSNPLSLFKTAVFATETAVADALLVYRLFVVWERNVWVIIVPSMLVLSTAVVGYGVTYNLGVIDGDIFGIGQWVLSYFSITLTTNVLCTLLISYRIWRAQRALQGVIVEKNMNLNSVIQIVVESGALYSSALIIMIVVYLLQSNAQYAVLDPITPIIGIVFSMIIIRVALGISHGSGNKAAMPTPPRPRDPRTTLATSNGDFGKGPNMPMSPLAVTVTRGVITHSDRTGRTEEEGSSSHDRASVWSSHEDLKYGAPKAY